MSTIVPFTHRRINPDVLVRIFHKERSIPSAFHGLKLPTDAEIQNLKHPYKYSVAQVMTALEALLGSVAVKRLLEADDAIPYILGCRLLDYFVNLNSKDERLIDIQTTLIVAMLKTTARTRHIHAASIDGTADLLLGEMSLPADFKLSVRQKLFDQKSIDNPFMDIYHYE